MTDEGFHSSSKDGYFSIVLIWLVTYEQNDIQDFKNILIMKDQKNRILFIMPLPPPVHGSAMMSQYIKGSKAVNEKFLCDYVNLSTSRSMSEIGKKSPIKIFRFFNAYLKTFLKLCTKRYDLCYLAITCHGRGFLKDTPFALLCKLFGNRIVIHQHNKGMSKDVDKPLYKFLFKAVYKNAKVILLSDRLYPDISSIVDKSQVMICPNGVPKIKQYPKKNNAVPRLLFLSNLIESKGVLVLLDACKILKRRDIHSFVILSEEKLRRLIPSVLKKM